MRWVRGRRGRDEKWGWGVSESLVSFITTVGKTFILGCACYSTLVCHRAWWFRTQAEHSIGKCVLRDSRYCHFLQDSLLLEAVWHLHTENIVSLQELLERCDNLTWP